MREAGTTKTWVDGDMESHELLRNLGPKPLSTQFTTDYLFKRSRDRRVAIKNFIMNGRVVVVVFSVERPYGRKLSVNDPVIIALFVSNKTSLQLQHTQYCQIIVHLFTAPAAFTGLGCDAESGLTVLRR